MFPAKNKAVPAGELELARFSVDVTIPLGHRCMGILPVKAKEIVDPLFAKGFVLRGEGPPVVVVSVDWCEIRNAAHDQWRDALARAAGTSRERVLVSSVHQHDAPVIDPGAEARLAAVGLGGELCDLAFHERTLRKVADAVRAALADTRPVTSLGLGAAMVERVVSNRRVVGPDGHVEFRRGSGSGGDPSLRDAPAGLVDPWLRTLSFFSGDTPLVALHVLASHPMSYYGRGGVSADFVGMARGRFQEELPSVLQVYASGCSGDVTAGKYNDGTAENRPVLASRLHAAMRRSWESTRRVRFGDFRFRSTPLSLDFHPGSGLAREALERTLADPEASLRDRILAAMGLSSRDRVEGGRAIDLPCLDLGAAQLVLFPGEAFVAYQLMAQRMRADSFVLCLGYGECWPGYIPSRAAEEDGFGRAGWRWVAPGAEERIRRALWRVLPAPREHAPRIETDEDGDIARDVFPATGESPRNSEGSILPLADGSLLYATTEFLALSDFSKARIIARTSADGGKTWSASRVLQENVGAMNVMSASLKRFRSPVNSGIGLFYLVKNAADDLKVHMRLSTDEGRSFGPAVVVTRPRGYHVMNNDRVVELSDGRLLCPVAFTADVRRENHFVSTCYLSDDGGATWSAGRGRVDLPRRGAMEPEVVELVDGRLLMILRTQLGEIWASHSPDRGESWSEPRSWRVASPEAPATLRRIPSTGDFLLVYNPKVVEGAGHGGPRSPLVAAVSKDEGSTWMRPRVLEPSPESTYAYTSLTFVGERVLLSYYVREEKSGRIAARFRSLPLGWFYREGER